LAFIPTALTLMVVYAKPLLRREAELLS